MIISHSKKFVFIHIYKIAGTSISTALRKYNYLPSKLNKIKSSLGIYPKIYSRDFPGHVTAEILARSIPKKIFDDYFKFAFVRNPWDWQVSLYHFAKQSENHHQHDLIKNMSFEEYIYWRVNEDLKLQMEFICDSEENILVDYIGKIEKIDDDFTNICRKINLPQGIQLPKLNTSNHQGYRGYYNDKTRNLIAEAFRKDIELFGYEF